MLIAATIGEPLHACGGGTIPLLQQWLASGMSMGSATAFMITGPATKITNLVALKIVLGIKQFLMYLGFVMVFALLSEFIVNLIYLQNAKNNGVTKDEIAAIITHATMYTGWPKGWAVFRMAKEVWE